MFSRLADATSRRPKRWLLAALAVVLLAAALGGPVAGLLKSTGGFDDPGSQSIAARERIEQATGRQVAPGVIALVRPAGGVGSAAGRRAVADVSRTLRADPAVAAVDSYATTRDPRFLASDRRSTYVAATLAAAADEDQVAKRLESGLAGRRDVALGGPAVASSQMSEQITTDLATAELIAFPLLMLLSLLFFRSARAAVLPLVIGFSTILGTFLALRGVNEVHGLSIFALNLVIGLALGLAVDYSLFMVNRYREELDRRGPGRDAIAATLRSAGRTILFSSITVAAAMASLIVFPLNFLKSMGIGGAVCALVAATVAITLTPAFLALWGERLRGRPKRRTGSEDRWYRLSQAVMRRPGAIALVTGAVLVAVALPALGANWVGVDAKTLPASHSARVVSDTLDRDYPRNDAAPLVLAVRAPRGDGARVAGYARSLARIDGVLAVGTPRPLDAGLWLLDAKLRGSAIGADAQRVVREVRAGTGPFPVEVGGVAAQFRDSQSAISGSLPLAVGILVATTLLVLWLMTGSVVLPIKAILMNALTVGAALGLLVLVFQDGRLEGPLDYTSQGGIDSSQFVLLAALVFGLSTDYGVFLLARIKEARDGGLADREAVAVGLQRTGGIVTAAAVLLAVAIGAFVVSEIVFIKQVGIGTAAGVLIDAFIVRTFLVPSLMALLGRWNWWAPRPLRRLHARIGLGEGDREGVTEAAAGRA